VIIIQKYYRRWLATKYVDQVRANQKRRKDWERQEEINKIKEKEDRIKKEYGRRMNPKSKEDFNLLYHALESK
jgi:IQ and ubiquitin-like domain-containing protein